LRILSIDPHSVIGCPQDSGARQRNALCLHDRKGRPFPGPSILYFEVDLCCPISFPSEATIQLDLMPRGEQLLETLETGRELQHSTVSRWMRIVGCDPKSHSPMETSATNVLSRCPIFGHTEEGDSFPTAYSGEFHSWTREALKSPSPGLIVGKLFHSISAVVLSHGTALPQL
jgi:hypothetical protein